MSRYRSERAEALGHHGRWQRGEGEDLGQMYVRLQPGLVDGRPSQGQGKRKRPCLEFTIRSF